MADEIKLQDGEYHLYLDEAGMLKAKRHGENWPAFDDNLRFSKVVGSMFNRILNFEKGLAKIKSGDFEDLGAFVQLLLDDEIEL